MSEIQQPKKEKNRFTKGKIATVIGVLIALGIIASAASSPKSNTETVSHPSGQCVQGGEDGVSKSDSKFTPCGSDSSEPAATPTPQVEKMTISNSVVKPPKYGYTYVDGEIKNNDTVEHTAVLKATFYDQAGKILGTATGSVSQVAPGDTKTFELVTNDVITGYANMKVQVDTLI